MFRESVQGSYTYSRSDVGCHGQSYLQAGAGHCCSNEERKMGHPGFKSMHEIVQGVVLVQIYIFMNCLVTGNGCDTAC